MNGTRMSYGVSQEKKKAVWTRILAMEPDPQIGKYVMPRWNTTFWARSVSFLCKRPDNQYPRLYGPDGLRYNCSTLLF